MEHTDFPRVKFFTAGRMRSMILASSEKTRDGYHQRTFGHNKVIKAKLITDFL
jgi:hypothetical protein